MNSIDKINSLNKSEFINFFGNIFEKSEWIAEEVFKSKPYKSLENFKSKFVYIFENIKSEEVIKILNSHPELVVEKNLTTDSTQEQNSANLNNCTKEEFEEFKDLNYKYKKKFGFPFIIAVKGMNRLEILNNFRIRIKKDNESELNEAKEQVKKIASIRLDQAIK
tara:strand:- start:486 stop:980 length:495 start_codon:yes stop_codon:yes gene_type:complete